jgi:MoaA/NifB/PqqE/SkfB family radical SAM enzyme
MHPELDDIVARLRRRGIVATLITNGYYLSPDRIARLNRAGLDHLQISIDNVEPDDTSKKSLRLLEPKLRWLAQHADFSVTINSVLGSGIRHPDDALVIARRARELGFMSSVGIIHDGHGQLQPLSPRHMDVYRQVRSLGTRGLLRFNPLFQENLARGIPNEWSCRAGARYLYVDEFGLVHYCSQQRGYPAVPLETYTREDVRREYLTAKGCAPYCTVNCVQQVGLFDNWRSPQRLPRPLPAPEPGRQQLPAPGLGVLEG